MSSSSSSSSSSFNPSNSSSSSSSSSSQNAQTISKPFIYGSASFRLQEPTEQGHSHRWTVYVRGVQNEDMSYFISKVVFHLHHSFANPTREIVEPPYEVQETGWGEFDIPITVYFEDKTLKPQNITQRLKLFNNAQEQLQFQQGIAPSANAFRKPVMSEHYDEFSFYMPNPAFRDMITSAAARRFDNHRLVTYFNSSSMKNTEERDLETLKSVSKKIQDEIERERRKFHILTQES